METLKQSNFRWDFLFLLLNFRCFLKQDLFCLDWFKMQNRSHYEKLNQQVGHYVLFAKALLTKYKISICSICCKVGIKRCLNLKFLRKYLAFLFSQFYPMLRVKSDI
jgi:hypothetical protein